jgi:signal transduction histidine kinase
MRPALSKILGLCGKAKRVALNTEFFAQLDGEREPPFHPKLLRFKDFMRVLSEGAEDKESVVGPERGIRVRVDKSSFEILNHRDVVADIVLLDQAIRNLLDNAGKYSFENTEIVIHGGYSDKALHVSVDNTGLALRSDEVVFCTIRGWRSDKARWTTGEGSGIGLWLVEKIMKRHKGELVITPTNSESLTQVHLVLPFGPQPMSFEWES